MARATSNAHARGTAGWAYGPRGLVAAVLLASLLPGCPLSDSYFVDPNAGLGGLGASMMMGGTGGRVGRGDGKAGGKAAGTGGLVEPGTGGFGGLGGTTPGCVVEPEICDGISNDCDDEIDEDSACPAGCSATTFDSRLYVLCFSADTNDALGASEASARCGEIGMGLRVEPPLGLVWIESARENDFLKAWIASTVPSDAVLWMSANDENEEGAWVWGRRPDAEQFFAGNSPRGDTGGEAYMDRYHDFASGEPNGGDHDDEDCGAFDPESDWQWMDEFCTTLAPGYVCEQPPPGSALRR
jgi:hypothetical protein